jgi:hypothetical protein
VVSDAGHVRYPALGDTRDALPGRFEEAHVELVLNAMFETRVTVQNNKIPVFFTESPISVTSGRAP